MKVLGTDIFLDNNKAAVLRQHGYKGTHNQFRIICKCRGIDDANRKCKEIGLCDGVFRRDWASQTGDKAELALCEEYDIWIKVEFAGNEYVRADEVVRGLTNEMDQ